MLDILQHMSYLKIYYSYDTYANYAVNIPRAKLRQLPQHDN